MILAIAGMALMAGCKGSGDPKEMGQEKPEVTAPAAMDIDPFVSNPNDYTAAYPDAEAYGRSVADNTREQNGGTALEEVTMLDTAFFLTRVTADGKDQTVFVGARDGRVVRIVMAGKDNQENPELRAMLGSITFT
jgi:hypothetical protein